MIDDPEREDCKNTPRRADSVSSLFHFFYPVLAVLSQILDILVDALRALSNLSFTAHSERTGWAANVHPSPQFPRRIGGNG